MACLYCGSNHINCDTSGCYCYDCGSRWVWSTETKGTGDYDYD